jgi:hypothetical protein
MATLLAPTRAQSGRVSSRTRYIEPGYDVADVDHDAKRSRFALSDAWTTCGREPGSLVCTCSKLVGLSPSVIGENECSR